MTEGIRDIIKAMPDEDPDDWINKAVTVIHRFYPDFVVEDYHKVIKKGE